MVRVASVYLMFIPHPMPTNYFTGYSQPPSEVASVTATSLQVRRWGCREAKGCIYTPEEEVARQDMSPQSLTVSLGAPLQLVFRTDGYFLISAQGRGCDVPSST